MSDFEAWLEHRRAEREGLNRALWEQPRCCECNLYIRPDEGINEFEDGARLCDDCAERNGE